MKTKHTHLMILVALSVGVVLTQAAFTPSVAPESTVSEREAASVSENLTEAIRCNAVKSPLLDKIKHKDVHSMGLKAFNKLKIAVDPRNRLLRTKIEVMKLENAYVSDSKSVPIATIDSRYYITQMYDPVILKKNVESIEFRLTKLKADMAEAYASEGFSPENVAMDRSKDYTLNIWIYRGKNESARESKKIPHKTYAVLRNASGTVNVKFSCLSRGF